MINEPTTLLSNRRLLAVGAHPDDIEFICSGTMILLRDLGWELHVATLSCGDGGSHEHSAPEISRIRLKEAEKACELLGAGYHYAGFTDFGIFNDDVGNRRVTATLRNIDPAIVLTHPPADYMSDHEITSRLVRNACFCGPVRNYDTVRFSPAQPTAGIPHLYYAQPVEGIDILGRRVRPHFYVDITGLEEAKAALLACHESQRNWLRAHHGMDEYLEAMVRWGRELGAEASALCGRPIGFAEAFQQHRGHAYPSQNVLRTLLGDRIIEVPE